MYEFFIFQKIQDFYDLVVSLFGIGFQKNFLHDVEGHAFQKFFGLFVEDLFGDFLHFYVAEMFQQHFLRFLL